MVRRHPIEHYGNKVIICHTTDT